MSIHEQARLGRKRLIAALRPLRFRERTLVSDLPTPLGQVEVSSFGGQSEQVSNSYRRIMQRQVWGAPQVAMRTRFNRLTVRCTRNGIASPDATSALACLEENTVGFCTTSFSQRPKPPRSAGRFRRFYHPPRRHLMINFGCYDDFHAMLLGIFHTA